MDMASPCKTTASVSHEIDRQRDFTANQHTIIMRNKVLTINISNPLRSNTFVISTSRRSPKAVRSWVLARDLCIFHLVCLATEVKADKSKETQTCTFNRKMPLQ